MKVKDIMPLLEGCPWVQIININTFEMVAEKRIPYKKIGNKYNNCDVVEIFPCEQGRLALYIVEV